ncbi:hypothetical protein [Streptomyces sp. NPDC050856]|uniref:hypothetical protein n=1 Tax=Streptomyces sp. NPDC050856 TaxID=3154939 RepID=UPI0033DF236C
MDQKLNKPDGVNNRTEGEKKRLDLSAAQVAGSAVAAVLAATLASKMGVYGTIAGAGVISVIATCGGSVFQHLFKSTGERVRVVTVQAAAPVKGRRAPLGSRRRGPAAGATAPLPSDVPPAGDGQFGAATVHGARVRGWKRPVLAAALVFFLAMAGITVYELAAGQDLSGGKGTTVSSVVRGGDARPEPSSPDPAPDPGHEDGRPGHGPDPGGTPDGDGATGRDGTSGAASPSPSTSAPSPSRPADGGTAPGPDQEGPQGQDQDEGPSQDPARPSAPAPSTGQGGQGGQDGGSGQDDAVPTPPTPAP